MTAGTATLLKILEEHAAERRAEPPGALVLFSQGESVQISD